MDDRQRSKTADYSAERGDMWVRLGWVWTLLFYIAFFVPVLLTWSDADTTTADRQNMLLLTGLVTIWHWGGTILLPRRYPQMIRNPAPMSVVLGGIIFFWYLLTTIDESFFFSLMGVFSQVFILLPPRFAIPTSLLVSVMVAYLQITSGGTPFTFNFLTILFYIIMAVVAVLVAIWLNAIIDQSRERRTLIEQLEQSQNELAAAERRAGTLAERQRLAHEIHDTIAQGFISIIMHLEAADQALATDKETVQTHLDYAQSTARASLKQARRVVDNLRPESLEGQSLTEAIERTAENWSKRTGIAVHTKTTGDILALHPDVEVTLLRVTQEALNNVRKHAGASNVDITLSYMQDIIILDVQDNGIGLIGTERQKSEENGGYGLVAMRQRVDQFKGKVTIESDPGEGTTLVVEIPIGPD